MITLTQADGGTYFRTEARGVAYSLRIDPQMRWEVMQSRLALGEQAGSCGGLHAGSIGT